MGEISYKTIGGRNFMLVPCAETGKNIDTQIRMLTSGGIKGILPVTPTSKNGIYILQYDITGLTRLSGITQYGKLNREQFSGLIEGLLSALDECSSYALLENGVCLDNDCIYFDAKTNVAKFVYIPTLQAGEPMENCKEMLRSFIAYGKVDHDSLTALVTDVINSPSFSFSALKDVLRKHRGGGSPAQQFRQFAQRPPQPIAQPQEDNIMPAYQAASQPMAAANPPPVGTATPSLARQAVPPFTPVSPSPPMPQAKAKTKTKSPAAGGSKNLIIIIVTAVISLAVVIGSCFTSIVRTPDGGFDITKVLGVAILIGALDFLLLRNKLTPKNPADAEPANITTKEDKKKIKEKAAKKKPVAVAAPMPSPAPFAPPVPQHQQQPVAAQLQQQAPVFTPAPAPMPMPTPVRSFVPEYSSVSEPESDETVVFDEPAAVGGLYLQTASGEMVSLSKSPFLVGRDKATSDYALNDGTVGRRHAEFSKQGDGWVIVDQNSRNHTFLNETCLNPYTPYPISAGDTLRLANVTLWVKSR